MSTKNQSERFEATLAARSNRVTFGSLYNRFVKDSVYQRNNESDLRLINSFFEFLHSLDDSISFINTIALKAFLEQIVTEAEQANALPEDLDAEKLKAVDTMTVVSIATMIRRSLEGDKEFKVTDSVKPYYDEFLKAIIILSLKKA